MKDILKDNEAIEAYESVQASYRPGCLPMQCGYFTSDDCEGTDHYDTGSIVAFDNSTGLYYEEVFSTVQEAIDWINQ